MDLLIRIWRWFALKYIFDDPVTCSHEWVVYSTAINDGCLEVSCTNCAILGSVTENLSEADNPSGNKSPDISTDENNIVNLKLQLVTTILYNKK